MNRRIALLLLQLAAFWPVWQWYAKRFAAGNPDDQWCLLAGIMAIAFLLLERKASASGRASSASWLLPTGLMLLYAATFHWLPPLLRAVLAVTAVGVTMSQCLSGRALRPAIGGLFVLALPVIPLLQFYLGYPLRVVVGSITAPLLQIAGLAVVREGTSLNWNGQLISIDAPCSGIKMLWAGMFLCCAVAWVYRLSAGKTLLAGLISLVVIVVGNILRASSLFYLEAGIVPLPINPNFAHDGVGIVTFIFTAIGIVASSRWLQNLQFSKLNPLCETSPRSFSPVS
jgi:exosortase/archaeosortase family protein